MYECQDCTYSTNWSYNLKRHEKFKHNPNDLRKHEKGYAQSIAYRISYYNWYWCFEQGILQADSEYQKKVVYPVFILKSKLFKSLTEKQSFPKIVDHKN